MSLGKYRRRLPHRKKNTDEAKPTDLRALKSEAIKKKIQFSKTKRTRKTFLSLAASFVKLLTAKIALFKPCRVWKHYRSKLGQIIAAGLSFLLFFSIVALVFLGLNAAGWILNSQPGLLDSLVNLINRSAPRLLTTDTEKGLIDPKHLVQPQTLFPVGILAFGLLLSSALGWLNAVRNGTRTIFGVEAEKSNIFMLKLRDAAAMIVLGVAMLLSVVLAFGVTQTLKIITQQLHVESNVAAELIRYAGLLLVYFLDVVVSFIIFRIISRIKMSWGVMLQTVLLTALGLSVLRILGTTILGAVTRYPEFAVYAVPLGLLLWFNFINQIYLLGAAWGAISVSDQEQKTIEKLGGRGRYYEEITGWKRIFS